MSAVWVMCRAAVRRRRMQTVVVGVVVGMAALTLVFALGLLSASRAPFQQAFTAADGAHVTATFDPAKVDDARLRATRTVPGVTATAGPYRTATLPRTVRGNGGFGLPEGTVLVGRASPGGPVDRLTVRAGRWVRAAGEVVVSGEFAGEGVVGQKLTGEGLPTLTVVGVASSATGTASAWVTPAQTAAYADTGVQMLYRFSDAGTVAALRADLTRVSAGLPHGALLGSENYLAAQQEFQKQFDQILPFVTVFGMLAAVVALIIILNVVSGAVVAGVRTIGVMKAIGFTPVQSTAVYAGMIAIPAAAGCLVGDAVGGVLVTLAVGTLGADLGLPALPVADVSTGLLAAVAVLAAVVGTALVPALRAGRLSAARAISPLTAARAGRFRGVQRFLTARSLPSPVGLGLSLPFARPARTALTLVTVVLGALTVTLSTGLHDSVTRITSALNGDALPIAVQPGTLTRDQIDARLRALPGTAAAVASTHFPAHLVGVPTPMDVIAYRGDSSVVYRTLLSRGRWFRGGDEALVSEAFLRVRHHRLGDTLDLTAGGRRTTVRIVGTVFSTDSNRIVLDSSAADALGGDVRAPAGRPSPMEYNIALSPGTDAGAYQAALRRTFGDALIPVSPAGADSAPVFDGLFLVFTLLLCVSAALGVLNTVVLDTRERARDLGVLKSIGMTPRQVVAMVVTSMAALGVLGGLIGLPLGVLSHHRVLAVTGDLIDTGMPARFVTVYHPLLLVLLGLAGPVIGVLGALLPAARAGRMPTAPVLRSE